MIKWRTPEYVARATAAGALEPGDTYWDSPDLCFKTWNGEWIPLMADQVVEMSSDAGWRPLERGARRLVTEVWALVDQHVISARSPAADAALDLRDEIDPEWMPERKRQL